MPRLPGDTVLMIIDVQNAIDDAKWGPRNNADAEHAIAALLDAWREGEMPIVHVRHDSIEPRSPYRPGQPGNAFKAEAMPREGETIVAKNVNSAFIGTNLDELLNERGTTTLVICGVLTHNSVEATVRHAGNLGYRVFVARDACWAVDVRDLTGRVWSAEDVHQLSLAKMHREYAVVTDTATLLQNAMIARAVKAMRAAKRSR
jgi:nicotinamidase-related amidase